jgi:tetratricopeptide (TPR) repeat protein
MLLLLSVPLLFGLRLWLALLLLVGVVLLVMGGRGRFRLHAATWFILLLALVGWAVSLVIEVIFIRDHLAGDAWYRMNTVFKFGYQIWALLALAAAASLPHLVRGLHVVPRAVFMTMLAVLVAIAAVFPVVGTPSRLANRFYPALPPTLDGLAFMEYAQFEYDCRQFGGCQPGMGVVTIDLAPDAAAIAWLNENISGMPVVLQSDVWFYRAYGVRVASNTGLPTIVSPLHASEQHNPEITAQRSQDVNTIFTTRDRDLTLRLLAKYGVHYIYVGPVERAIYAAEGLQKFQEMVGTYLEVAYEQAGVVIYEVQTIPPFYRQPLPSDPPDVFAAPPPDAETSAALEALEELEQQVAADPTSAVLAYGLAERYRDANRLDDAARVLAVAADANPNDVALHHLWGDILTMAGRHDEAEQAYLRAAQSSPTAGNWNKLGMALLARGEHERAELFFTMALTADPQAADPYYGLGVLYSRQGKRQEALDALERYVELAPDGPLLGDAQRLMAELRSEETSGER